MSKVINTKILNNVIKQIKEDITSEHSEIIFKHTDANYMVERAKEELLTHGSTDLAIKLLILARVKHESQNRKK